jgi:hypothetical protein
MSVLRLRRSEPGSCGCTGLPLPAALNLPAFFTGTIGPHTQGRAHRFPPYRRGALPAARTNPESCRRSIPTPALPFPHPCLFALTLPSPSPAPEQVPCILHSNGIKEILSYLEPYISRDTPLWSVVSMAAQRRRSGYQEQRSRGGRDGRWRPFRLKQELLGVQSSGSAALAGMK